MRGLATALLVLTVCAVPGFARGETVSVTDLEERPQAYDGRSVTVRGELVGDYGVRRDAIWVQLNDDPYVERPLGETGDLRGGNVALGVRLPSTALALLEQHPPGRYGRRGPIVEVAGVFRYHDPALGGETYLDASELRLVEPARPIDAPVRRWPAVAGAALLGLAVVLAVQVRRTGRSD